MEKQLSLSDFDDIRPFMDDECLGVIKKLMDNNAIFFKLSKMAFPRFSRFFPSWTALLCRSFIAFKLKNIHDIHSFQINIIGWFFFRLLDKTSDGITHIWKHEPKGNKGYLLLSNHRDIAVDPAVICHSLYLKNMPLPMIGVGDNLLSNRQTADLMRLNQSFIVKRTFASVKEIPAALRHLSMFIRFSIDKNKSIWLAQREGRAKDSRDRTSTAVLKMLCLSCNKDIPVAEALNSLNIRPVSISYQYDPCDIYKAKGMAFGERKKTMGGDSADLEELSQGITGYKGKINVVICDCLNWHKDKDIKQIKEELDKEIISGYKLFNSHFYGLAELVKYGWESAEILQKAKDVFQPQSMECRYLTKRIKKKLQDAEPKLLEAYLRIYANPILEKLSLIDNS